MIETIQKRAGVEQAEVQERKKSKRCRAKHFLHKINERRQLKLGFLHSGS